MKYINMMKIFYRIGWKNLKKLKKKRRRANFVLYLVVGVVLLQFDKLSSTKGMVPKR